MSLFQYDQRWEGNLYLPIYFILIGAMIMVAGRFSFAQSSLISTPLSQNFLPAEYQGGSQNWAIAQDKRGFLYVANHYGLLEFDGNKWSLYRTNLGGSLKSVRVDSDGDIYVGGQGKFGYFSPDTKGKLQYQALDVLLPEEYRDFDEVWDIYDTSEGMYFFTRRHIFLYQHKQFQVFSLPKMQYAYYYNYKLFVSSWEKGLMVKGDEGFEEIKGGEIFKRKSIRAIVAGANNQALIATLDGELYRFDGQSFEAVYKEFWAIFEDALINCVRRLKNGQLAIGTQDKGLYIIGREGNLLNKLDKNKGLNSNSILDIYEDAIGNLWVGQNNGLTYIYLGLPFSLIDQKVGIEGPGYAAAYHRNKLFLGTSNGVYELKENQFEKAVSTSGQVYNFYSQNGQFLLGHHNGTFAYENNKFKLVNDRQGSWMFQPVNGKENTLIGGHYAGLQIFEWADGHWQKGKEVKNFKESSRLFYQSHDGSIWISHGFKGVYKLELNAQMDSVISTRHYGEKDGFPSNELINLFKVQNRLVFGTIRGAYQYIPQQDKFRPDSLLSKYLGNSGRLIDLSEDVLGNLYYILDRKVGYLKKNRSGAFVHEKIPFSLLSPLLHDDLEKIIPTDLNQVLISAREGFIAFDPSQRASFGDSLKIFLREIHSLTNDSLHYFDNLSAKQKNRKTKVFKFPFKDRFIKVRVSSPQHQSLGKVQYRFKLKEFDRNWTPWSEEPSRELNGLSPGTHELWVEAKSSGNLERSLLAIIYIYPPWYLSWWIRIFYVLGTITAMMLVGWLLWKRFILVQDRLIRDKEEALLVKDAELEKVALQSENTIQKIHKEKLESEIKFKNQELTTSTMHLLAKNAFLQSLKERLEQLAKDKSKGASAQNKSIRGIIQSINQNLNDEEEWEKFSFHFSQVHGDFFARLKERCPELSPQELKLSAYLRMNMTTKEIAQLLNISIRGVETGRYRLRKKLELDSSVNLIDFMMKI